MRVSENQVFNLMDTNGRRSDVINAIQSYISVLKEVTVNSNDKWGNMPKSLSQYKFFKKALMLSPDVFERHTPFDKLEGEINKHNNLKKAITENNMNYILSSAEEYEDIYKKFDSGIEDRARHLTSNLVKLGFADEKRNISDAGELLINPSKIDKDELEELLPIDETNLIYLRQLLKLRIFSNDRERFYSPFAMALYMLLTRNRVSENVFFEIVQGCSPYSVIHDLESYLDAYKEGDIVDNYKVEIPTEIINENNKINRELFEKTFTNKKSTRQVDKYWNFYEALISFYTEKTQVALDSLLDVYEENKDTLCKAFGRGHNIFNNRKGNRPSPEKFLKLHTKIFTNNINVYLYKEFAKSKQIDQIKEYSDTTKRVFKATGIISFDNGYAELANKELCYCIFDSDYLKNKCFGNITEELDGYYETYEDYEEGTGSYFCKVSSLSKIFDYSKDDILKRLNEISEKFGGESVANIPDLIVANRKKEFCAFINKNYPAEKVKTILGMFSDRTKDKQIKELVSPDASVPTIYEYIVGIAWYYFSGQKIDLLKSYNLTLSADFEPLVHAGGGQGDIVDYEEDKVIMLEATLMNTNSQKRGEWEPVLRHSVNLKVEEDENGLGRDVTTFFIADNFDTNTINIWKAIASVPMQSSIDRNKFTDNVIIMPIDSNELALLMDRNSEYNAIIKKIRLLFEEDKVKFDMNWRKRFINELYIKE